MTQTLKELIEAKVQKASLYAQGKEEYEQEQEEAEDEQEQGSSDDSDDDSDSDTDKNSDESEDSDDQDDTKTAPKNKVKESYANKMRHILESKFTAIQERSEYAQMRAGEDEWRRSAGGDVSKAPISGKFKLKHPSGHFISGHASENEALTAWKNLKNNTGVKIVKEGVEYDIMESDVGFILTEAKCDVMPSFSDEHLNKLRQAYSGIDKVDPTGETYKKMTQTLNGLPQSHLVQIRDAGIPFLSGLARNRVNKG